MMWTSCETQMRQKAAAAKAAREDHRDEEEI